MGKFKKNKNNTGFFRGKSYLYCPENNKLKSLFYESTFFIGAQELRSDPQPYRLPAAAADGSAAGKITFGKPGAFNRYTAYDLPGNPTLQGGSETCRQQGSDGETHSFHG
jgi:hypothetical protein